MSSCIHHSKNPQMEAVSDCYVEQPEWTKNAVIYEVNIRQHTPEGTLEAFSRDLSRIKELGVDIVWLMPVFPIGELNRKADQSVFVAEIEDTVEHKKYLGSPYSTKDYMAVNPDFGTMDDLKSLVDEVHELGMYIILDIAANHTAWDHEWIKSHPDYYTRIEKGSRPWNKEWMIEHPEYYNRIESLGITYPIDPEETDWWDTADLNFGNDDLRMAMIEVFKYWVSELDIDGYRCDMAGKVPTDFWNEVREELNLIKPVFMLAEDEDNSDLMESAFNMNYDWKLHHLLNGIAKGDENAVSLKHYFKKVDTFYSKACYRMRFITNHDENAWNGSEFERMGDATEVMALLTYTIPGMPLLYTGQELGMNKRLLFFEKDSVDNIDPEWEDKYKAFIKLKKDNKALWNGSYGGEMKILESNSEGIFTFTRTNEEQKLLILANLSGTPDSTYLPDRYSIKNYSDVFTGKKINPDIPITLTSYGYLVLKEIMQE